MTNTDIVATNDEAANTEPTQKPTTTNKMHKLLVDEVTPPANDGRPTPNKNYNAISVTVDTDHSTAAQTWFQSRNPRLT